MKTKFWIPNDARARHTYIIGKTRMGKTDLGKVLCIQEMYRGHGIAYLDPNGDAAWSLLGNVPPERVKDVIYLDPTAPHAPAFNLFRLPYPPHKLAEDVISVFQGFFDSWGDRMEHLLRYALLTLLRDQEPHTLADLKELLLDEHFRTRLIRRITAPALRRFWRDEFPAMGKSAVFPLTTKLSAFLAPGSDLERLFSQVENDLDFPKILNERKILFVNLKKSMGKQPMRLLGGLLVTGIQQAALARVEIPEHQRQPFHLFVDEFQNFVVQSFDEILAESGKYRLFLTMMHQTLKQVPDLLVEHIFGNVGVVTAFRVSANDAARLCREMQKQSALCRIREHHGTFTFTEWLAYMHQTLTEQCAYYTGLIHTAKQGPYYGSTFDAELIQKDIARALKTLATRPLSLDVVKELTMKRYGRLNEEFRDVLDAKGKRLFPDMVFTTVTTPNPGDLTDLERFHAYCKVDRTSNVFKFTTKPAPAPDDRIRHAILDRLRRKAEKRARGRAEQVAVAVESQPEDSLYDETDRIDYE